MQQSSQNGDPIENSRHATSSPRVRRAESGAAVVLVALLGAVAIGAVGCDGDDTTNFPPQGGSSGSGAGRSGAGGTTAGAAGRGGSSGASGAAGTTAGMGGAGGNNGGMGGTTAGTGGTDAEVPDGGTDSGLPDADVPDPLTRPEMAAAICARYDELDGCEPSETCTADFVDGAFPYFDSQAPSCTNLVDAYFSCAAVAPITGFSCQDGLPGINIDTCPDEAAAMYESAEDAACD